MLLGAVGLRRKMARAWTAFAVPDIAPAEEREHEFDRASMIVAELVPSVDAGLGGGLAGGAWPFQSTPSQLS